MREIQKTSADELNIKNPILLELPSNKPYYNEDLETKKHKILNSIRSGNYFEIAYKQVGFSAETINVWRKDPNFEDFFRQVRQAEADAEVRSVARLLKWGEKDPKWLAWWLERTRKERWSSDFAKIEIENLKKDMKELVAIVTEFGINIKDIKKSKSRNS